MEKINPPALPPFEHPSMASLLNEDGLYPDLQTLLEHIPEDAPHHKLYISGDVRFMEVSEPTSLTHQTKLKELLNGVLNRIGAALRIDEQILDNWVEERVEHVVDEDPNSVFTVAALILNGLESKQQILACADAEEALAELMHQLSASYEEE